MVKSARDRQNNLWCFVALSQNVSPLYKLDARCLKLSSAAPDAAEKNAYHPYSWDGQMVSVTDVSLAISEDGSSMAISAASNLAPFVKWISLVNGTVLFSQSLPWLDGSQVDVKPDPPNDMGHLPLAVDSAISPDGKTFCHALGGRGLREVYCVGPWGESAYSYTTSPIDYDFVRIAISPMEQKVLFAFATRGPGDYLNTELFRIAMSGDNFDFGPAAVKLIDELSFENVTGFTLLDLELTFSITGVPLVSLSWKSNTMSRLTRFVGFFPGEYIANTVCLDIDIASSHDGSHACFITTDEWALLHVDCFETATGNKFWSRKEPQITATFVEAAFNREGS